MTKKYFKTLKEARAAADERNKYWGNVQVFKMPKGTRHHGMYAVCTEIEYLNTY